MNDPDVHPKQLGTKRTADSSVAGEPILKRHIVPSPEIKNLPSLSKTTYTRLLNEDIRAGEHLTFYDWPERIFLLHPPPHNIRDVLGKFGQEIQGGVHPYNNPSLPRSKNIQDPGVRQALKTTLEKHLPRNNEALSAEQNADITIKLRRIQQWLEEFNFPTWVQNKPPVRQVRFSASSKKDFFPNKPASLQKGASYHGLLAKDAPRKTPPGTTLHTGVANEFHPSQRKRGGAEIFVRPNVQVTEDQPEMRQERWPHKKQKTAPGQQFPKRSHFPQKH